MRGVLQLSCYVKGSFFDITRAIFEGVKEVRTHISLIPAFSSSLASNNQMGMERVHFFVCKKK